MAVKLKCSGASDIDRRHVATVTLKILPLKVLRRVKKRICSGQSLDNVQHNPRQGDVLPVVHALPEVAVAGADGPDVEVPVAEDERLQLVHRAQDVLGARLEARHGRRLRGLAPLRRLLPENMYGLVLESFFSRTTTVATFGMFYFQV